MSRRAVAVALLLALAFAARVALVQSTVGYRPINDAGSYAALASWVARTGDYPTSASSRGAGGSRGPSAYFPPAYPYLLAAVDVLDGHSGRTHATVHDLRLVQAAIGAATAGLVYLVALEALGAAVALIALALAAVYPPLITLGATLSAENLLVALELLALWAALRSRRAAERWRQLAWVALAGVSAGLATLTHENGIVLLVPLVIAVWPISRSAPVLLVALIAVTIAPWTIRNAIVMHRFIPVTDETGMTLAGTYNVASAANERIPYAWRVVSAGAGSRRLSEPDLESRLQSKALHYIAHHPFAPLEVAYHNTRRLLELEGSYAWRVSAASLNIRLSLADIGVVCFWLIAALAVIGAFSAQARRAPGWLWLTPLLLFLSVVFVNAETPRFRAPIDPFLLMLAACALAAGARKVRTRR